MEKKGKENRMPMALTRNDVHKPSSINPADYEFVAQECMKIEGLGDCYIVMENRAAIKAHMARTGGTYSGHEHGGNCGVCGSVNAIYTVLFYHEKTNSYVRMGQDCAEKCNMGNENAFRTFRSSIQEALERKAGKAKAQALLSERGLARAWEIHEHACDDNKYFDRLREEQIIFDIVGKLVQYGNLSDKQFQFLEKLLKDIDTRAERMAQRAAEAAAAKPCPEGRIEVAGTVISTKYQTSEFGETLKMLVKSDDGWKVWGTVPSSLEIFQDGEIQRGLRNGDRIKFTATVTPSKDDNKFGFFKRPTKAERL